MASSDRCQATTRDGRPCSRRSVREGYCVQHERIHGRAARPEVLQVPEVPRVDPGLPLEPPPLVRQERANHTISRARETLHAAGFQDIDQSPSNYTVVELKKMLRALGVPTSG